LGLTPSVIELSYGDSSHLHAATDITVNNAASKIINYDGNGNMIFGWDAADPQNLTARTIEYNAENMPVQISAATGSTIFTYDENGRRIKKSGPSGTTYSIGEHFEVINGTATCYIFAGSLRIADKKGSQLRYYHKDHLGSTAAVTDQGGNTLATMAYLPYGGKRGAADISQTSFKYTDQELDAETGLYNYDARLYDPVVGRFISADSILPKWYDPQSLNRYAYARNNPILYSDPSGHSSEAAALYNSALAAGWSAALIEPTPFGEVAMIVVTVGRGLYTLHALAAQVENGDQSGIRDCPIPAVEPVRKTKGGTQIGVKENGDWDTANEDFNAQNPTDIKEYPGGTRAGTLPDGRTIIARPNSSDGRPTVEIQKNGKKKIEIRYGKEEQNKNSSQSDSTNKDSNESESQEQENE
jgi:RHS repeat-associated protein